MNSDGPYVSVAALCDAVLKEADTNRISCVRFMDRLDVNLTFPVGISELPVPLIYQVHGLIAFKSGGFRGKKTIKIKLVTPSGKLAQTEGGIGEGFPAFFEGGEHGFNLTLDVTLQTEEEGLYYFDVLLDDEMVTRIPLRVTFTKQTQVAAPQPESSMTADKSVGQEQS